MTTQNTNTEEKKTYACLEVTSVQVFPFTNMTLGSMKALASITLNDQLAIRGLRVVEGKNGLFVSFPNDPFYKGEDYKNIVFPITRELKEHVEKCVLEKFQAVVG